MNGRRIETNNYRGFGEMFRLRAWTDYENLSI